MIRKIDTKYLDKATEYLNDTGYDWNKESASEHTAATLHGEVFIEYGEFVPVYETQVVSEPVPVLGKIFPFIKRKVTKQIDTGRKELALVRKSVSDLRRQGENVPAAAKSELARMPYSKIIPLDREKYGDGLFLAQQKGENNQVTYDILSQDGIVIGHFSGNGIGYYSPDMKNNVMPEDVGLDDAIAHYCAKNPDTIEYIPEQFYKANPKLASKLEQQISQELETEKAKSAKPTLIKE